MSISFKGATFPKTTTWLEKLKRGKYENLLNRIGELGVEALSESTPKDTSRTANSWSYTLTVKDDKYRLSWVNSVMAGQTPLVLLIEYGHGTKNGGYVSGRPFITSALEPVFEEFKKLLLSEINH